MATETTYTYARANLKSLFDEVAESREPVYVRRREGEDVAIVAADELRSLLETAYLLRSPANAERLLAALKSARGNHGRATTLAALRKDLGFDGEK